MGFLDKLFGRTEEKPEKVDGPYVPRKILDVHDLRPKLISREQIEKDLDEALKEDERS
jgi:hypothetical protein